MSKLLLAGTAALLMATSAAHARGITTTCNGQISWYPFLAYTAISDDPECIFVTKSRIGKRILKVCPKDSQCSVEADIQTVGVDTVTYEITRIIAINRTGTPSLDAIATREKTAREKHRWLSVLPYMRKAMDCVITNKNLMQPKTQVADDASVSDILSDGACSRAGKTLRDEFTKQFSYVGHYINMNYKSDLEEIMTKRKPYPKWWFANEWKDARRHLWLEPKEEQVPDSVPRS